MPIQIPASRIDLLQRPIVGHLGTIRPDQTVQVNPMWFGYDGEHLRFTHTRSRAKFRNLEHNPAMSLSVSDPDNPYRYLEVRGRLARVIDDPTGGYYVELAARYGMGEVQAPSDAPDRVILVMSPDRVSPAS